MAEQKKTNEISLNGAQSLVSSIREGLKLVSQGYLAIAPDVAKLYECKGFKALGYKNFDELCAIEFGMSHGTTVGIRKVFDKFGSVTPEGKYIIPEKYKEYGYTKLLLFTDKQWKENNINPIEEFTPDQTIASMRNALKLKLEEKAKKQDETAIDVTPETGEGEGMSMIDNSEAPQTEAPQTEAPQTEAPQTEGHETTPLEERLELINEISRCAKLLHDMCEEVKPEKLALLDAISANISDFEKVVKKIYK